MSGDEGPGRPSRPREQPPRREGPVLAWLPGTAAGLVAVAFVVVAIVVVVLVVT